MTKHLWEIEHPYYCSEGNYYRNGQHEQHASWEDFLSEWGSMDEDMNLVFRWDWHRPDPADYEPYNEEVPGDTLKLYYMMQRKALNMSVYVTVTEADEPAVREWLTGKAEHMRKLWEPLLDAPTADLAQTKILKRPAETASDLLGLDDTGGH